MPNFKSLWFFFKENHSFLSGTYNMDLEFEYGCGEDHSIGKG